MKNENTQPLVKDGKRLSRRFLGNINPENVFEKKELKAYLKGHTHFQYRNTGEVFVGINNYGERVYSNKVRQEYFYV